MRHRIKVKSGLIGSSDFRRVKSRRVILEENHKKNLAFFASIKPKEVKVEIEITEQYLRSKYSQVLVMTRWEPISKYVGSLVFMFNNNYQFI